MENARMIILCMARSQKPLCLTAGKFTTFCLSTLTDVRRIYKISKIFKTFLINYTTKKIENLKEIFFFLKKKEKD